jgi:hypothetical protein
MGTKIVRTIGVTRTRMKIGMQNLAYKLRRFVTLEPIATAAAWSAGRASPGSTTGQRRPGINARQFVSSCETRILQSGQTY